jgi:hypothetical protein
MLAPDRGISLLAYLTPEVSKDTNCSNSNNKARYIIPNNNTNGVHLFSKVIQKHEHITSRNRTALNTIII